VPPPPVPEDRARGDRARGAHLAREGEERSHLRGSRPPSTPTREPLHGSVDALRGGCYERCTSAMSACNNEGRGWVGVWQPRTGTRRRAGSTSSSSTTTRCPCACW